MAHHSGVQMMTTSMARRCLAWPGLASTTTTMMMMMMDKVDLFTCAGQARKWAPQNRPHRPKWNVFGVLTANVKFQRPAPSSLSGVGAKKGSPWRQVSRPRGKFEYFIIIACRAASQLVVLAVTKQMGSVCWPGGLHYGHLAAYLAACLSVCVSGWLAGRPAMFASPCHGRHPA